MQGGISPVRGTIMSVLQHKVREGLKDQNYSLCTAFLARQGMVKSESPLSGPLLVLFWIYWLLFWQVNLWEKWPYMIPSFAAFFAAWSANQLSIIIWVSPFWWPGQCIMSTFEGLWTASNSDRISEACLYCLKWGAPFLSRLLHEHAPWRMQRESVYIFTHFP